MEFFESKKAILEHCGKDGKDVRWLDRALKDGRVGICDGAYYVTREYIADLEKENGELEEEMVKWREKAQELEGGEKTDLKFISKAMGEKVLAHGEINRLNEEMEGLKSDLEFQISENGKLEAKVKRYQDAIRNSFYYINNVLKKKVDWPTYKATIKLEGDLPGEDNQ